MAKRFKKLPCPHCGKTFAVQGFGRHEVKCAALHSVPSVGTVIGEKAAPAGKPVAGKSMAVATVAPVIGHAKVVSGLAKLGKVMNLDSLEWDLLQRLGGLVK